MTAPLAGIPTEAQVRQGAVPLPAPLPALPLFAAGLDTLAQTIDGLDVRLGLASTALAEADTVAPLLAAVDAIRTARTRLALLETHLERKAGEYVTEHREQPRELRLSDGRLAKVGRRPDRKEWKHDEWKHDVRAELLDGIGPLVDTDTGAIVDAQSLLAAAQAVHGAQSPKITELRALGLKADDYCTTVRGVWQVTLEAPKQ